MNKTHHKKASVSHDEVVIRQMKNNPGFAAEYLRVILEENDSPEVLLRALRQVAEAQGMAVVAAEAGLKRESLYRVLSPKGNPTLKTIAAVAKSVGLRLSFEPIPHTSAEA
ncbi:MAG: addiction module antidote protein [Solidesulfovibrio sp.]